MSSAVDPQVAGLPVPRAEPAAAPEVSPPAAPPADLGRRTARGAGVTLVAQAGRILLQLLSVTVLARLLSPRDYGLLAVGLVVVGVGEVVRDMGLSTAAVRTPDLTTAQRDGLFWLNAASGVLLAALLVAGADVVAALFSQPALAPIARALAATFLLNGLAAQYRAGLMRQLRFAAMAGCDLAAQVLALAAAITAAVLGAGYWALVAQQLVQVSAVLVGAVLLGRWLPGRPRRGAGLRPLVRFGGGLVAVELAYYLGNNLDNLSIGYFSGPASLGLYNRGFQLLMTPLNQLRSPATTVAVPVLSRLQSDLERSGEYLRRSQLALGYTLVAGMAVAAGASAPIVDIVLGSRWHGVAPVLALLAVAGCAQTLAFVGNWVYLSRGLSGALLRYTLLTLVLSASCIAVGSRFGVVGVAAGYATAALLEWPLSLWWLSRITVIPLRALVLGALRITACAVAAGAACAVVVRAAAPLPEVGRLVLGAAAAVAVYGATALVVPVVRADLRGVAAWGRSMLDRR